MNSINILYLQRSKISDLSNYKNNIDVFILTSLII